METTTTVISPPASNKVYFLKEILSNGIVIDGKTVFFENVGGGRGVLELDPSDPAQHKIINTLIDFAKRGVGGVSRITGDDYTQKKSLPPELPFRRKETLRIAPRGPLPNRAKAATAAEAAQPASPAPAAPPAQPTAEAPLDIGSLKSEAADGPAEKYSGFQPATRRISRRSPNKKESSIP